MPKPQRFCFLASKRGDASLSVPFETSEPTYPVQAGFRLAPENLKQGNPAVSNEGSSVFAPLARGFSRLTQLASEYLFVYRQIGLFELVRYLRGKRLPRPLYVDGVIVEDETGHQHSYQSRYGVPLKTAMTAAELSQLKPVQLERLQVTQRFDVAARLKQSLPTDTMQQAAAVLGETHSPASTVTRRPTWLVAGLGNYTTSILLPSILKAGGRIVGLCSQSEASAFYQAKHYGAEHALTDFQEMVSTIPADNVLIATPHLFHPSQLRLAMAQGLGIYCEKPVAITQAGLAELLPHAQYARCMVGFNRRFAPAVRYLFEQAILPRNPTAPIMINYLVNYGNGYHRNMADLTIGGGTIHGACCHYLDLIECLAGSLITQHHVSTLQPPALLPQANASNNLSANFNLANGGLATLTFSSLGRRSDDVKERIILYANDLVIVINDFSELIINGRRKRFRRYHYGGVPAMAYFQAHSQQGIAEPAATLQQGIHISELTLQLEASIKAMQQPVLPHSALEESVCSD